LVCPMQICCFAKDGDLGARMLHGLINPLNTSQEGETLTGVSPLSLCMPQRRKSGTASLRKQPIEWHEHWRLETTSEGYRIAARRMSYVSLQIPHYEGNHRSFS